MDPNRLKGKNILITGAARGMGAANAEAFASQGANVCIGDLDLDVAVVATGADGHHGTDIAILGLGSRVHGIEGIAQEIDEYAPQFLGDDGHFAGRFIVIPFNGDVELRILGALAVVGEIDVFL